MALRPLGAQVERVEQLLTDLRLAARRLGREPGHLALAVLAVALGTGVTTAIFSVVETVLLRPLPFARPDRLLSLYEVKAERPEQDEHPSPGNPALPRPYDRQGGADCPSRFRVSLRS